MALPVTITGIATAVASVGPFKASVVGAETLYTTNTSASAGLTWGDTASGWASRGQTFTTTTATLVSSVRLSIWKTASPTDNLTVSIYATDGSGLPTGSALGTSNIVVGSTLGSTALTGLNSPTTFTFATPVALSASTKYALMPARSTGLNATNYYNITGQGSSPYAGGNMVNYNGTTYTASSTNDLGFAVYGVTLTDAYYFIGRSSATSTTLQAYKSTDPEDSLVIVDTKASTNAGRAIGFSAANEKAAQTFTTIGAVSLKSFTFSGAKTGSPTDNILADIYLADASDFPTGSSLGQGLIAASSVPTTNSINTITWTTPVALSAATKYCLVVSRSGALSNTNVVSWYGGTGDVYAGGKGSVYVSGAWTTDATTPDYTLRLSTGTESAAWTSIATKTGFTTAIQFISSYQVGNVIHMVITDGSTTSINHKYQTFDCSTDTFVTAETINSALNTTTSTAANSYMTSIVVRSTAEVVVHYSAARISTFSQTAYRRRTGVATWAAGVAVSATGVNTFSPMVVLGASDRLHFLWYNSSNTQQRHLTSANVLGTAASTGAGLLQDIATFIDAGPTVRFVGIGASHAARWSSADNPTVTTVGVATGQPVRIGDTGGVFYALYRGSADSDLYITTSPDKGATWTTGINVFTGTVALADANLSMNQLCYTRGTSVVFPYIVNDNGTLRYNEYSIPQPTADAWNVNDKSVNVDLTNSDRTATANSGTVGGVRSYQTRTNETAGKYYWEYVLVGGTPNFGARALTENLSGASTDSFSVSYNGNLSIGTTPAGSGLFTATTGDVICYAWDTGAEKLYVRLNTGNWNDNSTVNPSTGVNGADASAIAAVPLALAVNFDTTSEAVTLRTRAADLTVANKPSGYTSWMGESLVSVTNYTMPAATGAIVLAGPANKLARSRDFNVDVGAIVLAGIDVVLTKGVAVTHYTMPAATGTVVLGGVTTGLIATRKLSITVGAVVLGGVVTGLRAARFVRATVTTYALAGSVAGGLRRMAALTGTITLGGVATKLGYGRKFPITVGNIALGGVVTGLRAARFVRATVTPYTLTGIDVTLSRTTALTHYTMPTTVGAITLNGQTVTLKRTYIVPHTVGTITLGGVATALRAIRTMPAVKGSLLLTGVATGTLYGHKLTAVAGAFTLTGVPVTLRYGHVVGALTGAFTLNGQPVSLVYGSAKSILASTGTVTLAGPVTRLVYARKFPIAAGTVTLGGVATILRYNHVLPVSVGSLILSGIATALRTARVLPVTKGAFTFNGQSVAFRYTRVMPVTAGSFVLNGLAANLIFSNNPAKVLPATVGAITLGGVAVTFRRTDVLKAVTGAYALNGVAATLRYDHRVVVTAGAFTLNGQTVILKRNYAEVNTVGTFLLNGSPTGLAVGRKLVTTVGAFLLNGVPVGFRRTNVGASATGAIVLNGVAVTLTYTQTGPIANAWDKTNKSATVTLSNGDRTARATTTAGQGAKSTQKRLYATAGKWYAEFVCDVRGSSDWACGMSRIALDLTGGAIVDGAGNIKINNVFQTAIGSLANNDVISIAYDSGGNLFWARKNNGVWNNSGTANPATGIGGFDTSFLAGSGDVPLSFYGLLSNTQATVRTQTAMFTQTLSSVSSFKSWMNESLAISYTLSAATGAVTLAGSPTVLRAARKMTASVGTVTLAGTATGLRSARLGASASGALVLNGLPATLRYAHVMAAVKGSFLLNGQTALLRRGAVVGAAKGSLVLNGIPVNLVYHAVSGVNVWGGTGWVDKPAKVWAGSAWMQKPVKTWNGSAWV